ncbi:MAG TPA: ATP-binding protein [Acidobacteriota bacterium]|nr:ATP-binding protein [Acidobacteriota bacterium]
MKKSILDVLLERSKASVYIDGDRKIVKIKGETDGLLSVPAREALGTDIAGHLAPAYRDTITGIMERCLNSGRSESVSLRFLAGSDPRQILFVPRDFSSSNWPEGAVIQLQDITSGARTFDISFLSHELFNSILNDIGEGIIVLDPALNITHVNDFAMHLLGLKRESLLGEHFSILPAPLLELLPKDDTARIFEQGLESHKVVHLTKPNGDELSLLLNFYPVKDADGLVTHVVETLQDITEEQKTAKKIQAINRRLQEKVRELSVLNKLSVDFNVCTEGDQLYPRVVSTIVCGLGFRDTVAILSLRDAEGGPFRLRAFFGEGEDLARRLISKPDPVEPNTLIITEDSPHLGFLKELGLKSAIYSPIFVESEAIGYLNVYHRSEDPLIRDEETLLRILSENLGHFIKRIRAERALREKVLTLSILKSISDAFKFCKNLSQLAYVYLTGVTAEQGLGFNRALLFLLDDDGKQLHGTTAIGPATPEEADRIWKGMQHGSEEFARLLLDFSKVEALQETELNRRIRRISLPCDGESFFCRVFDDGIPTMMSMAQNPAEAERKTLETVGIESFAAAPLFVASRPTGLLLVDNFVTGKPISDGDLRFLHLMTLAAQGNLENMRLYEELETKVESLKRSNELLQEHRTRLAKLQQLGALGEMAASVAHEIRNPLVSIGGFARSLCEDKRDGDPDLPYLKIIAEEVSRLEKVVSNLLNFAKPMKAKFQSVSLRDVIQQAIAIVEPEFADDGLRIVTRLDRIVSKAWLDPHLIRHMLLNLINNARRAMSPGGKLTISSKISGSTIRIAVRDTGKGIPKDQLEKIFEPFFTTRSSGTGLGLSIVHNIVKTHGGSITVKSRVGSGTTFLISLPRVEANGLASVETGEDTDEEVQPDKRGWPLE